MTEEWWNKLNSALDTDNQNDLVESFHHLSLIRNKKPPVKNASNIFTKLINKIEHKQYNIRSGALFVIGGLLELSDDFDEDKIEKLASTIATKEVLDLSQSTEDVESYNQMHNSLCIIITELQNKYPKHALPHFSKFGPYLVSCTQCESQAIATAACSYWRSLKSPPVPSKYNDAWIPPILKQMAILVPALVSKMTYHKDHVAFIESITQTSVESEMPERIEHMSNLRNFAAMGLENLCRIFPSETTAIFIPLMDKQLKSESWLQREAIILAIGAFMEAVGKPKELQGVYPTLIQKLFQGYSDPKPLVRSITCFTMQQFINIKVKKDPLGKMIKYTLSLLNDEYKEVQDMALRSLAAILAYGDKEIAPYAPQIIENLVKVDSGLNGKVRYLYYECISHVFGRMGILLDSTDAERLMKPMMNDWEKITFEGSDAATENTIQLCQPFCIIAAFSKDLFAPWNDSILKKVFSFASGVLEGTNGYGSLSMDHTTKYLVSFLDLVSAMFEGQGNNLKSSMEQYKVAPITIQLLENKTMSLTIKGSAFALLGNICEHCPTTVQPHLDTVLDTLRKHLDIKSEHYEVTNNALWTLSNVAKCADSENEKLLNFCEILGEFAKQHNSDQSMMINAVLGLTSLGQVWPKEVICTVKQEQIFTNICMLLQTQFPRDMDRVSIFKGICAILSRDIKAVDENLWPHFIATVAMADCKNDEELKQGVRELLQKIRSVIGSNGWNRANQQLGSQVAYTIRRKYKMY